MTVIDDEFTKVTRRLVGGPLGAEKWKKKSNLGDSQIRVDVIDFHVTKYRSSSKMDLTELKI